MADRTVSVALRADVTAYIAAMRAAQAATRNVSDEMRRANGQGGSDFEASERGAARLAQAMAQLLGVERERTRSQQQSNQQTRRSTDETRRQTQETDRNTESNQRNRRSTDESQRSQENFRRTLMRTVASGAEGGATTAGWIGTLVAAATAIAPAATAAVVSLSGFAAVAASSIIPVVNATADLAGKWETLDDQQKASAVLATQLADNYHNLAASYEPQALSAFNNVVADAQSLMPNLTRALDNSSVAVQGFGARIGGFIAGQDMKRLIDQAGANAPQALDDFGAAAASAGSTVVTLANDMLPLGTTLLSATRGMLGAANAAAHFSPLLSQLVISSLLLRAPITGLVGGVAGLSGRIREGVAATRGMTLAQRGLNLVAAAGPAIYIAAGAALFVFASRALNAKSATDKLIDTMRIESGATANNLAGREKFIGQLQKQADVLNNQLIKATQGLTQAQRDSQNPTDAQNRAVGALTKSLRETQDALDKERAAMNRVQDGADLLSEKYGITRDQALDLATAAGVDLSKSLDKTGHLTTEATAKIQNYEAAVQAAKDPTQAIKLALDNAANSALAMKDRVTALTAALDGAFNPSLAVFQATTQMREGYRQLADQIGKASGSLKGNSQASLQLRQAFAQQLSSVKDLATAEFQRTHNMDAARNAVIQQLPLLYALAGRNREAKAQVDALATSLGINTSQLNVSKAAFIAQATAMLGSRTRAEQLWAAYQRLTGATNTGSGALSTYIKRVTDAANQARIQALRTDGAAGAQQGYNARVQAALPVLYALAGRNQAARAQVDALARATGNATGATNVSRSAFLRAADAMGIARSKANQLWKELNKIKDRKANITVNAKGLWTTAHDPSRRIPGLAAGGPVPAIGPESTEAYDSVPAILRVNEHVWTPEEVRAVGGHGAMLRMRALARRGQLQGFATGGPVNFAGSGQVSTVMRPIDDGIAGLIKKIGDTMAAEWKKAAGSGGPVVAAARAQIGKPYVWGATGPNAFDCSGLTWWAWKHGAGIDITRTTYTQRQALRTIGSPIPGAVGQPHPGHTYLYAGNGRIIEAPHTGAVVRETSVRGGEWWGYPRKAQGGAITLEDRRLGERAIQRQGGRDMMLAKLLGLAGDPGGLGIPGFATGGWVKGKSGRDRNVIAASHDEFVVRAPEAKQHGLLLEAINQGLLTTTKVGPSHSGVAYGPSHSGVAYGPSHSGVAYGPSQSGVAYGPSHSGVAYGPSHSGVAVGPSHSGVAVGPSHSGVAYGPSEYSVAVGPSHYGVAYGPGHYGVTVGGDGAYAAQSVVVKLTLQNYGAIGSQLELQNWLAKSLDMLSRAGRAPWPTK